MAAQVYFVDMRAGLRENLHTKLERLTLKAGLTDVVSNGDLVAVKMHFGEKGGIFSGSHLRQSWKNPLRQLHHPGLTGM